MSPLPFMLLFGPQNINCTFVLSSKPLNMLEGTLFVVCLPLNTLFLLFCGILSCICISGIYLVAVFEDFGVVAAANGRFFLTSIKIYL